VSLFDQAAGGLAGATPWGAALGALGSALGTTPSSSSNAGPVSAGPVNVNVSGFGSNSSGNASANAQQSQQPATSAFAPSSDLGAASAWLLPGAILLGLVFIAFALKKG